MILELRLRELFWAQTKDGEDGKNPPERIPYPPLEGEEEEKGSELDVKAAKFQQMEKLRAARRSRIDSDEG